MELPSFSVYVDYQSEGYGSHALRFDMDDATFWFSYKTLVAFRKGGRTYVRQNDWGPTTGKHLNAIDGGDRKSRLTAGAFDAAYRAAFDQVADNAGA